MKRNFVKKFEKPLQCADDPMSKKYELVTQARIFIKSINLHLQTYQVSEPREIDIVSEIERHLLIDYIETEIILFCGPMVIHVAGYEGICDDYLEPMLIEIRSNSERAHSHIEKIEHRHYDINISLGENEYSGYLILTVTNNFIKSTDNQKADPVSTGIGLKNIQYYAGFFQKGNRQGWAQFKTEYKEEYGYFTVEIYFPLWKN